MELPRDRHTLPRATVPPPELAVIGGGVIGLAIAGRAAREGLRVTLLERETLGAGASSYAAGMLAPVSEAEVGHGELLEDGLAAAAAWPAYAAELGVEILTTGTLLVARDRDEAEALDREHAFRERLGLRVERLLPSAARRLEPALAPTVRAALHVPDDHAVDPRAVLRALERRAREAGVDIREHAPVERLEAVEADAIVLAAGAWSAQLMPDLPVRPVKGQILRLRDPGHASGPLLERVLRFEGGYIVPRGDGRYVLGATVEERGFDTTVTAGGLHDLLRDATELVPGISELVIEETGAGLRPGTPGNLPLVERRENVLVATGHFRNGILLAPLTAQRVVGELALA
jgi:glycine oxidase